MANKTVFVAVLLLGIIIVQGFQDVKSNDEIIDNLVDSFENIPSEEAELGPETVDSSLDSSENIPPADESPEYPKHYIHKFNSTLFEAGHRIFGK